MALVSINYGIKFLYVWIVKLIVKLFKNPKTLIPKYDYVTGDEEIQQSLIDIKNSRITSIR